MSTISAGTSSGTALVSTGDTSGNLELQSSGVTKLTVGSGGVTLASALSATSGGTGATTYTTGDLLYASATNTLSKLGIGSSNQVLSVSGGVPAWATPSAGAMVFISSSTASSSSTIQFALDSTYDCFVLEMILYKPSVDNTRMSFQLSTDAGSSWVTSNNWTTLNMPSSGSSYTVTAECAQSDSYISLTTPASVGTDTNEYGASGFVYIYKPSASTYTFINSFLVGTSSSGGPPGLFAMWYGAGQINSATAKNRLRIYPQSGNITSGTFRLYGIANS